MSGLATGSVVTVCMTRNDRFPFQTAPMIRDVKILHKPCDVGDTYHFELPDGTQFTVNPMCSDFAGIVAQVQP